MGCIKHGNNNIVGTCQSCGTFLCDRCYNMTAHSNQSICPHCLANQRTNQIAHIKSDIAKQIVILVIVVPLYLVGIITLISFGSFNLGEALVGTDAESSNALSAYMMCSVPVAIMVAWKTYKGIVDDYDRKGNKTYDIYQVGNKIQMTENKGAFWPSFFMFFICIIIGLVLTPIKCVLELIKCLNSRSLIKRLNDEIKYLRSN